MGIYQNKTWFASNFNCVCYVFISVTSIIFFKEYIFGTSDFSCMFTTDSLGCQKTMVWFFGLHRATMWQLGFVNQLVLS